MYESMLRNILFMNIKELGSMMLLYYVFVFWLSWFLLCGDMKFSSSSIWIYLIILKMLLMLYL